MSQLQPQNMSQYPTKSAKKNCNKIGLRFIQTNFTVCMTFVVYFVTDIMTDFVTDFVTTFVTDFVKVVLPT